MEDLEGQVAAVLELIIKLQLEEQRLNLVNVVYRDHVVMEMQEVETQVLQDQRHVKLVAVAVVELVQLQPMLVEKMAVLVELVKQVI
tara:strand:+ start:443 stop:703 length:261 start_codon:yes stop_codon:yes gene_type:complete